MVIGSFGSYLKVHKDGKRTEFNINAVIRWSHILLIKTSRIPNLFIHDNIDNLHDFH